MAVGALSQVPRAARPPPYTPAWTGPVRLQRDCWSWLQKHCRIQPDQILEALEVEGRDRGPPPQPHANPADAMGCQDPIRQPRAASLDPLEVRLPAEGPLCNPGPLHYPPPFPLATPSPPPAP